MTREEAASVGGPRPAPHGSNPPLRSFSVNRLGVERHGQRGYSSPRSLGTRFTGIAYELDDGSIGCVAGGLAATVPGLKSQLSFIDRHQFDEQMSAVYSFSSNNR